MSTRIAGNRIRLKWSYEPRKAANGERILIDRLWPRGVSKANAAPGEWNKELGPSTELRKWCGHDPTRWEEFRRRYREELSAKPHLRGLARKGVVTLVIWPMTRRTTTRLYCTNCCWRPQARRA